MTKFKDFEEVIGLLGVMICDLPMGEVNRNTDLVLMGNCLLVDLEDDVRSKAEALPVELKGRVTEHWGVRNEDGTIEVFVMKVREICAVNKNATPWKRTASLLSLLIKEGANLVIMHDKLTPMGCICGVYTGSRFSLEKIDFVRPKPFNDYDPYGESMSEVVTISDDIGDLIRKMREIAAKGDEEPEPGPEPAAGGDEGSGEGEQPEAEEQSPNPGTRNYEELSDEVPPGCGLSEREIAMLLDGVDPDSGEQPKEAGGDGGHQKSAATGGDNASGTGGTKNKGGW